MFQKKREGFTLAEVLITLAIIGVVAALTTPAIIRNSQNAKIGPQLSKIVTTFENAAQMAGVEQEKHYFKDVINPDLIGQDGAVFNLQSQVEYLGKKFMRASLYAFDTGEALPPVVGMNFEDYELPENYQIFLFTDKSALLVPNCTVGQALEGQLEDSCEVYAIMPGFANRTRLILGRDIFPLYVTRNGDLITPKEAGKPEDVECSDENITAKAIDGYTCVNRIAENGWKADW